MGGEAGDERAEHGRLGWAGPLRIEHAAEEHERRGIGLPGSGSG